MGTLFKAEKYKFTLQCGNNLYAVQQSDLVLNFYAFFLKILSVCLSQEIVCSSLCYIY